MHTFYTKVIAFLLNAGVGADVYTTLIKEAC